MEKSKEEALQDVEFSAFQDVVNEVVEKLRKSSSFIVKDIINSVRDEFKKIAIEVIRKEVRRNLKKILSEELREVSKQLNESLEDSRTVFLNKLKDEILKITHSKLIEIHENLKKAEETTRILSDIFSTLQETMNVLNDFKTKVESMSALTSDLMQSAKTVEGSIANLNEVVRRFFQENLRVFLEELKNEANRSKKSMINYMEDLKKSVSDEFKSVISEVLKTKENLNNILNKINNNLNNLLDTLKKTLDYANALLSFFVREIHKLAKDVKED